MVEMIYGRNPILEALKARQKFDKIMIAENLEGERIAEILARAKSFGVFVQRVPPKKIAAMASGAATQGVIGFVHTQTYAAVEDILARSQELREPPLLALLDGLQDPQNLGAVLRAADGAGVHGVILPKRRSAGLTGAVAKTSAGAVAHVLVAQATNLNQCIDQLKAKNIWMVGADQSAAQAYYDADLSGAVGIVIGGEEKGLHRLVKEKCDFLVRIPMFGKVNSLNAAVAAAVIFFEARRQRCNH